MNETGSLYSRPVARQGRKNWFALVAAIVPLCLYLVYVFFGISDHPNQVQAAGAPTYTSRTRTYFIAADEVRWNYAPTGKNEIIGAPFDTTANVFVQKGPQRIGTTYIKSLYREYTDDTFTHLKPVAPEWEHLGMLGPMIRAVVGDRVRVVLRNNVDKPASIHMHGLEYDKSSEGAPYNDGTSGSDKRDDEVPKGKTHTYSYQVPDRAGPGPMDGSSVMWMYHSHANEVPDDYGGLVGPVIVTKASMARPDGTPTDVDREFVAQYKISDESQSPYIAKNIKTFTGKPTSVNPNDPAFKLSNQMHAINGFVYGGQPLKSMTMHKGERVRWYLMGTGTFMDMHTAHWHGNTAVAMGMRTDVVGLMPMTMVVADMVPDAVGTWLFHCHVNYHIMAGMLTRYRVLP
jgi:FtsP/CotA-like multicopper oxidase with cupredoxin domain